MDLVSAFNPVRYGKIKHFQYFSNHENKNQINEKREFLHKMYFVCLLLIPN